EAPARGLCANVVAFGAGISACGAASRWDQALALLRALRLRGLEANVIACSAALRALGSRDVGRWVEGLALVEAMWCARTSPNAWTVTSLASTFGGPGASGGHWAQVLQLLIEARRRFRVELNSVALAAAVAASERVSGWRAALALLLEHGLSALQLSAQACCSAISACGRSLSWRHGVELLFKAEDGAQLSGTSGCNALLTALERARQWERSLDLSADMRQRGICADAISENAVLCALRGHGLWRLALRILFTDMPRNRVSPTLLTFSAAISTCVEDGRWQQAAQLLIKARRRLLQVDVVAFAASVSACQLSKAWAQGLGVLDLMCCDGVQLNTVCCNAALATLGSASLWQRSQDLLQDMQRIGLLADALSLDATLRAQSATGNFNGAPELLARARCLALVHAGETCRSTHGSAPPAILCPETLVFGSMSFYRAMTKTMIRGMAAERAVVPWYHQEQAVSPCETWTRNFVYPIWFKYVKGPYERYQYEHLIAELRGYGLMQDDQHSDKEPVVERALEILPHDLMVGRYRRLMRAQEMSAKKMHLPLECQNYDPMIPYMAPFIEEAKFQLQEEQELLQFHPWDRRLFSGPTTGLGETTPNSAFMAW
ncbi:unnamed protein product, partial [Polarella glacialis]